MNFIDAVKICFTKYADFNGCASRPEFWWWVLFTFIGAAVLRTISYNLSAAFSVATLSANHCGDGAASARYRSKRMAFSSFGSFPWSDGSSLLFGARNRESPIDTAAPLKVPQPFSDWSWVYRVGSVLRVQQVWDFDFRRHHSEIFR